MTALHYYRNDDLDMEAVPTVLRWDYTGAQKAEEGGAGTWEVYVDDPDMTLNFIGHRRWIIYEDDSDDANEVLVDGLTQAVRIAHKGGSVTNPQGRVWVIEIADLNTLFQYRVMIGSDSQRPEETDVERVTAIAESEEMGYFDDLTFIAAGSAVTMEEENVRGQYTGQVIDSCAQDTGKNWYIFSEGDHVSGTDIKLWYGRDSLDTYTSPLSLSNDPDDLDMQAVNDGTATVYPLGADTELRRDYGRQYSGAFGTFQGGAKYIGDTENPYNPGITTSGRDIVHPAPEIRSRTRMKNRLLRVLRDHATGDEVIKTTVVLPANKVTQLRAGMRVSTKATHEPGYESARYLRVLSAAPKPIGRKAGVDVYAVALELQGPGATVSTCSIETTTGDGDPITLGPTSSGSRPYSSSYGTFGDYVGGDDEGTMYYLSTSGGAPRVLPRPTPGPYATWGGWHFRDYGTGGSDGGLTIGTLDGKLQIMVIGPGTMTVHLSGIDDTTWKLFGIAAPYEDFGDDTTELDSGSASSTTVITVPDDGYCLHTVVFYDVSAGPGGSMRFAGWEWEAG